MWDPSFMLKSYGVVWWVGVVAHEILVSAQGPLVLGLGLWGLGPGGLTIIDKSKCQASILSSVYLMACTIG